MTTDEKIEALLERCGAPDQLCPGELMGAAEAVVNLVEEQRKVLEAVKRHLEAQRVHRRGCLSCSVEGRLYLQVKMALEAQEKK